MLCPLDVIEHLVALQGDPEPQIRQESLCILQIQDEKHATFLDNRLLKGIELAFVYQTKCLGRAIATTEELNEFAESQG